MASVPGPYPGPGTLSSAFAGRDGADAAATEAHTRGRGDRPRRRLLRPGGVVRLREGALRGVAAGRRTAAVSSAACGEARRHRRGPGLLLPAADPTLSGYPGPASGRGAARSARTRPRFGAGHWQARGERARERLAPKRGRVVYSRSVAAEQVALAPARQNQQHLEPFIDLLPQVPDVHRDDVRRIFVVVVEMVA